MGNGKIYNVILTTMSVLPKDDTPYYYYFEDGKKCYMCNGISQLEAGTKYFLSQYEIDQIIAIGTSETEKIQTFIERDGREIKKEHPANDFYKLRIADFLAQKDGYSEEIANKYFQALCKAGKAKTNVCEKIEPLEINKNKDIHTFIRLIHEKVDVGSSTENSAVNAGADNTFKVDNVQGIVRAILNEEAKACDEINIYMDMQGGGRTSNFVRNAVLSIISNETKSKVELKEIVAVNFNPAFTGLPSEIVNETKRYKIMDLAAAMNSFVRYGKADLLLSYCAECGVELNGDGALAKLLKSIAKVDDSISLCNTNALQEAITELKNSLAGTYKAAKSEDEAFVKSVFEILKDGIQRDYGELLTAPDKSDKYYLELISWCTRKGFIQQALTLLEDKMPKVFLKKAEANQTEYIITYQVKANAGESQADAQARLIAFGKEVGQDYYDVENNLFYSIPKQNYCTWNDSIERKLFATANKNVSGPPVTKFKIQNYLNHHNIPNANVENIKAIKNSLNNIQLAKVAFLNKYCEFRAKEKDLQDGIADGMENLSGTEKPNRRNWMNPERLYHLLKEDISLQQSNGVFLSLVHFVTGQQKNFYNRMIKNNQNAWVKDKEINITFKLNPRFNTCKKQLDNIFRLHNALKAERNCANHASEKGIRLPAKVVKRALEIYVEEASAFIR